VLYQKLNVFLQTDSQGIRRHAPKLKFLKVERLLLFLTNVSTQLLSDSIVRGMRQSAVRMMHNYDVVDPEQVVQRNDVVNYVLCVAAYVTDGDNLPTTRCDLKEFLWDGAWIEAANDDGVSGVFSLFFAVGSRNVIGCGCKFVIAS
jgi:hypothetical protein